MDKAPALENPIEALTRKRPLSKIPEIRFNEKGTEKLLTGTCLLMEGASRPFSRVVRYTG